MNTQVRCRCIAAVVIALPALSLPAPAQDPAALPRASAAAPVPATVKSKDGTVIAYEVSGAGPPMVLVASALSDRSDARRLDALLAGTFTSLPAVGCRSRQVSSRYQAAVSPFAQLVGPRRSLARNRVPVSDRCAR